MYKTRFGSLSHQESYVWFYWTHLNSRWDGEFGVNYSIIQ